jgi:putative ribosome biogenesis GTPase RsgA
VKAAFESGAIPRLRFESYQRIRENLSDRARKY